MWVFIRNTLQKHFLWVPTAYVLSLVFNFSDKIVIKMSILLFIYLRIEIQTELALDDEKH